MRSSNRCEHLWWFHLTEFNVMIHSFCYDFRNAINYCIWRSRMCCFFFLWDPCTKLINRSMFMWAIVMKLACNRMQCVRYIMRISSIWSAVQPLKEVLLKFLIHKRHTLPPHLNNAIAKIKQKRSFFIHSFFSFLLLLSNIDGLWFIFAVLLLLLECRHKIANSTCSVIIVFVVITHFEYYAKC